MIRPHDPHLLITAMREAVLPHCQNLIVYPVGLCVSGALPLGILARRSAPGSCPVLALRYLSLLLFISLVL